MYVRYLGQSIMVVVVSVSCSTPPRGGGGSGVNKGCVSGTRPLGSGGVYLLVQK